MSAIGNLTTLFGATSGPDKTNANESVKQQPVSIAAGATDGSLLSGGDQTVVSSMANGMAAALTTSDVRSDKVAQLQATIANGSYNVSSASVADKLMQSMLGGKIGGN
jgi:negative regulator of flagellin synthesis FlgM